VLTTDPIVISVITVTSIVLVTACSVTDILSRRIPNLFLATALSLGLLCYGLDSGISGLYESLIGLFIGLAVLMPVYIMGGTGAGDVKLLGVVGALLGFQGVFVAAVATLVSGGLLGTAWILWRILEALPAVQFLRHTQLKTTGLNTLDVPMPKRKTLGTTIPYAPAIASGTYFSLWHLGYFSQVAL